MARKTRQAANGHATTLDVASLPLDQIIPYARNPRKNEAAVAKVAASLREYGWRQPIVVDESHTVIAGHTRLLAAHQLGMESAPVHVARGLTPAQVKAYRLADNRVGQEATWDDDLLGLELADLKALDFDLALTGFEEGEIDGLLALSPDLDEAGGEAGPGDAPARTALGDVWMLGEHRLFVGDSTGDLPPGLDLAGPLLMIMDPPFDMDYFLWHVPDSVRVLMVWARGGVAGAWEASNLVGWGGHELVFVGGVRGWPLDSLPCTIHDVVRMWRHPKHKDKSFDRSVLKRSGARCTEDGKRPFSVHEHVGGVLTGYDGMSWGKPILAMELAMSYVPKGSMVWDPCAGSGTSLIAAEQHGRVWRGCENQVQWADLILKRWEESGGTVPRRVVDQ